jgi:hypothetical protein
LSPLGEYNLNLGIQKVSFVTWFWVSLMCVPNRQLCSTNQHVTCLGSRARHHCHGKRQTRSLRWSSIYCRSGCIIGRQRCKRGYYSCEICKSNPALVWRWCRVRRDVDPVALFDWLQSSFTFIICWLLLPVSQPESPTVKSNGPATR